MERIGRDATAEQGGCLEDRPLVLRQGAPDLAFQIAGHLPAHARAGLRRERQEDRMASRRTRGSLESDIVARETLRAEEGERRLEVEAVDLEDLGPRVFRDLAPHQRGGSRARDQEELRRSLVHEPKERPCYEPNEVGGRAVVVVEHDEDRNLAKIVGQEAGDDLRVRRPMLPEQILEAAAVMLTYAGKISGISATRIGVGSRPGARTSTMSVWRRPRSFIACIHPSCVSR